MTEADTKQIKQGRRHLLAIIGIAFVTLGGSYLMFYLASSGTGWGTVNHGAFVSPERNTGELGWDLDAQDAGHWFMWVVDRGCSADCVQKMADLRALHILLSREAGRVRRAYTDLEGATPDLGEPFPKLHRIAPGPIAMSPGVYIVDPNGNLVFFYEISVDPALIKEDLKRLLKVSQIG